MSVCSLNVDKETRQKAHTLRGHRPCWCDIMLGAETVGVSVCCRYCISVTRIFVIIIHLFFCDFNHRLTPFCRHLNTHEALTSIVVPEKRQKSLSNALFLLTSLHFAMTIDHIQYCALKGTRCVNHWATIFLLNTLVDFHVPKAKLLSMFCSDLFQWHAVIIHCNMSAGIY